MQFYICFMKTGWVKSKNSPAVCFNLVASHFALSSLSFAQLMNKRNDMWWHCATCSTCVVLWDFILLQCSYDAGLAASCRTLEAHMANWIWAAFQLKPEMELGNVIRIIRAGVDTDDNSPMARALIVPQLTHRTCCDVIKSGLVQISRKGRQRMEFIFVLFLL